MYVYIHIQEMHLVFEILGNDLVTSNRNPPVLVFISFRI